jgi:putative acetyltransferase
MIEYCIAHTENDYKAAVILIKEYANWLDVDLTFQQFENELLELSSMYSKPNGGIILCRENDKFIGCVGVRKMEEQICELKRMWVQIPFQHKGIGKGLLHEAIILAKNCGYSLMRLDTLRHMTPAINLYRKNGFYEIEAYYFNPVEGVVYFEKQLHV